MAVINRVTRERNGLINYASSVNRAIDDLYTLQAGNIDGGNLVSTWTPGDGLKDSAVTGDKFADGAISLAKMDATASVEFIIGATRVF